MLTTEQIVVFLQTMCVLLMFLEYIPQIIKLIKVKSTNEISFTYWATKISITILQFAILIITLQPMKVYLSHILSISFSIVVFSIMQYYNHKNNHK